MVRSSKSKFPPQITASFRRLLKTIESGLWLITEQVYLYKYGSHKYYYYYQKQNHSHTRFILFMKIDVK